MYNQTQMRSLGCIAATVFAVLGQMQAEDDLTLAAKSPYELERFFETHATFETAPLWKTLGVHEDETPLPECTDSGRDALRACSSELIIITDPNQAIVVLSQRLEYFTVYLRFVRLSEAGEQWKFGGFFEPFVKYFPSGHDVFMFGNEPYLLVTGQGAAGSGVSSTMEYWFDLHEPWMRPCLSRTIRGDWRPNGSIDEHVYSFVLALKAEKVEQISVAYNVEFVVSSAGLVIARRRDTAVFTRQSDGRFVFDLAQSTTTKKEFHELYEDLDDLSPDDFLRFNITDLKASIETPELRDWLADYLTICGDTREKRELLVSIRESRNRRKPGNSVRPR